MFHTTHSVQGPPRSWSLSLRTLVKRQFTPWTGRQSIMGYVTETVPHSHCHRVGLQPRLHAQMYLFPPLKVHHTEVTKSELNEWRAHYKHTMPMKSYYTNNLCSNFTQQQTSIFFFCLCFLHQTLLKLLIPQILQRDDSPKRKSGRRMLLSTEPWPSLQSL